MVYSGAGKVPPAPFRGTRAKVVEVVVGVEDVVVALVVVVEEDAVVEEVFVVVAVAIVVVVGVGR